MARTIRIPDVEDEVYYALGRLATRSGVSISELLRREASRLALNANLDERMSIQEWLESTRKASSGITTEQVLETLDAIRGPWPGTEGSGSDGAQ